MSNLYDDISRATGVARDDVKKVAHALGYSGSSSDPAASVRKGPNLSIVGVVIVAILGILWSVLT